MWYLAYKHLNSQIATNHESCCKYKTKNSPVKLESLGSLSRSNIGIIWRVFVGYWGDLSTGQLVGAKMENFLVWLCKGRQGVNCKDSLEAVLSLTSVAFISKSQSSFASWRAKEHSKCSRIVLANWSSMTNSDFSWSFSFWYTLMRERYSSCYIQHLEIHQSWVPLGKWNKKYKNLGSINNGNWTEWSAIWAEIICVNSKSNERAKSPNWPFSHRADSSSGVIGWALLGLFPFPCWRREIAYALRISCEEWNSLDRTMLNG